MTEAMPFLQKYDITFLRPPTIRRGIFILFLSFFLSSLLPPAGYFLSRKAGEFRAPARDASGGLLSFPKESNQRTV